MLTGRVLEDTEDMMRGWRLLEEGRKVGIRPRGSKLVISAIALHHGLTVVTRNRKDFEKAQAPVFNPRGAPEE